MSIVAWRKFERFSGDDQDFARWICTIARFETLKFRRSLARDRFVLSEDVLALLADEGLEEIPLRTSQRQALAGCLEKLDRPHRELVLQAYSGKQTIRELADSVGKSGDALYQLLRRIRTKLLACIERTLQPEAGR